MSNEQATVWNGAAGHAWVDMHQVLDRMFRPYEEMLVDWVRVGGGERVLDVGCGPGSTTLGVARMLAGKGRCTGVDISEPLLGVARAAAENLDAEFILADAESYPFEAASFDTIVSRWGVMFFEHPVRAFANLRRAGTKDVRLRFLAWRGAAENPFMTAAERAAAPLLSNLPPRNPGGPGQFAFADAQRVRGILEESGWSEIAIEPVDVVCTMREEELVPYLARMGPVGQALQDVDESTRPEVLRTVRAAFDSYVSGAEVRFNTACWLVSAQAAQ